MSLQQELQERWYLYQFSSDAIFQKLEQWGEKFYVGFDPTADSLHMGNFIGFMTAVQLMLRGNTYYALVWGATWMIGDPGWKDAERNFLDLETLQYNVLSIQKQIGSIIKRLEWQTGKKLNFEMVNNLDFYEGVSYLDFLREVGKYHTVNQMISKDTVKNRIDDPSKSISYTEFSYMLLQGFDYYYLHKNKGVNLQMGGQDQWWNLVTGIELIRKKMDDEVYCFTWPLITDATGKKFGKSEWNALFLDRKKTTPYAIYQYFMNTTDTDIERYLKLLTLLPSSEIIKILQEQSLAPEKRIGQKRLAYEVVSIIHGQNDAKISEKVSDFLFGESDKLELLQSLSQDEFEIFFESIGGIEYTGQNLFELFVQSGLEQSNSTARQTLQNGGIFVNEIKIEDPKYDVTVSFINDKFLLLRKGKKSYKIIVK
jgi:tyrosyl-tRNA synthetase